LDLSEELVDKFCLNNPQKCRDKKHLKKTVKKFLKLYKTRNQLKKKVRKLNARIAKIKQDSKNTSKLEKRVSVLKNKSKDLKGKLMKNKKALAIVKE